MGTGFKSCLKKIFGATKAAHNSSSVTMELKGETQVLRPAHTVRLKPDPEMQAPEIFLDKSLKPAAGSVTEMSIVWCGMTDAGRVRDHNEDFFSCTDMAEGSLFVVADGMGGHDAGEVASQLAVETVIRAVRTTKINEDAGRVLERAVQCANDEVLNHAVDKGSNMGTTLTLALIHEDKAYIANVGDSRTYWIEDGSIKRITEDHSLVEKLVSVGKLTREQARRHPKSNVLYRNIGSEAPVRVDTFQIPLKKGGSLLLCTDGLWGEVTDDGIHRIFMTEKEARRTCTRLIQLANDNGGKDNITAVVVKII